MYVRLHMHLHAFVYAHNYCAFMISHAFHMYVHMTAFVCCTLHMIAHVFTLRVFACAIRTCEFACEIIYHNYYGEIIHVSACAIHVQYM